MDIKLVPRDEIDKTKWNSLVHYADNGNIFGYIWYLDNVAKNWDALMEGDYESAMPLTWKKDFWGRKSLHQPALLRELGVFSNRVLSPARVRAFLDAIPPDYRAVDIQFNAASPRLESEQFTFSPVNNYVLLLNQPYEKIAAGYSPETQAALQEADLFPTSSLKPERLAELLRDHTPGYAGKNQDSHALLRIMYNVLHRGWGFASGVLDRNNQLLAGAFFIYSHGRVMRLLSAETPLGKSQHAEAYLFDTLIKSHAGRHLYLDLNTASPTLARDLGAESLPFQKVQKKAKKPWPLAMLFAVLLTLAGCGKPPLELVWEEQNPGIEADLSGVNFFDSQHGMAIGGDTWYYGVTLETFDGGQTWQTDTLTNKQLFGLHAAAPSAPSFAAGIDGYVFFRQPQTPEWTFHRLPIWPFWRGVTHASTPFDHLVLVGGGGYKSGVIAVYDSNFQTVQLLYTEYELNAVSFSGHEGVCHAAGYGILLRSADGGQTWTPNEAAGDHFRDIHFPSSQVGYVVGYAGAILKTTDAGLTWSYQRKGGDIWTADKPFRAVYFTDENRGYIAGDGGLLWRTDNGGEDWTPVEGLPEYDFYDVFARDGQGWLVGAKGAIIHFIDP